MPQKAKSPARQGGPGPGFAGRGGGTAGKPLPGRKRKSKKTVDNGAPFGYNIPCQRRAGPAAAAIPMGICIVVVR